MGGEAPTAKPGDDCDPRTGEELAKAVIDPRRARLLYLLEEMKTRIAEASGWMEVCALDSLSAEAASLADGLGYAHRPFRVAYLDPQNHSSDLRVSRGDGHCRGAGVYRMEDPEEGTGGQEGLLGGEYLREIDDLSSAYSESYLTARWKADAIRSLDRWIRHVLAPAPLTDLSDRLLGNEPPAGYIPTHKILRLDKQPVPASTVNGWRYRHPAAFWKDPSTGEMYHPADWVAERLKSSTPGRKPPPLGRIRRSNPD